MANELRRVDSYQYPAAHLGHLTDAQQEALDRFKSLCQEKGYYRPAGDGSNPYASHDDETMLYDLLQTGPQLGSRRIEADIIQSISSRTQI